MQFPVIIFLYVHAAPPIIAKYKDPRTELINDF